MAKAEDTVRKSIRSLLKRRKAEVDFGDDADLYEDLGMDSLEVAELSATLEDDLGADPYSSGEAPRTVAEVLEFYDKCPGDRHAGSTRRRRGNRRARRRSARRRRERRHLG